MPSSSSHSSTAVALTSSRILDTVGVAPKKVWEGIYMASCVNNADPLGQGRITMYVPQVLGTSISNWATPLGYGYVEIPPINAMVHCYFAGGDINQPVYIYVNTNNTSAAALTVGTGAAPQTATTTPTTAAGLTTGLAVSADPTAASVTAEFVTNSSAVSNASIVAGEFTTLGKDMTGDNFSSLVIKSPAQLAAGITDYVYISLDSAGSTFGNAGLNINYVDGNGATHVSAGHGSSGLSINAGSITAVQPGTGTSNTNAAASETWHSVPSILSGWSGTPRYKKQADNTVHLGGLVTAPGSGTVPGVTLWTMGTGYIPTAERYMPVVVFGTNSNYGGWLSIDTSGNVQLGGVGALNSYTFIFDGCRYPLD